MFTLEKYGAILRKQQEHKSPSNSTVDINREDLSPDMKKKLIRQLLCIQLINDTKYTHTYISKKNARYKMQEKTTPT